MSFLLILTSIDAIQGTCYNFRPSFISMEPTNFYFLKAQDYSDSCFRTDIIHIYLQESHFFNSFHFHLKKITLI